MLMLLLTCTLAHRPALALDDPELTVVTWNLNYAVAGDPRAPALLREIDGDLVLLQETTVAWEEQLRAELGDLYPEMIFVDDGPGGLGVLSRYPVEVDGTSESAVGWFPALHVEVATPLGELAVTNVHLKPPVGRGGSLLVGYFTTADDRLAELQTHLEDRAPDLVCGDFNGNERESPGRSLQDLGMVSALPQFHRSARTWHWPGLPLSWRLDHVYYGPRLEAVDARVIREGNSDHSPVVVRLQAR